MITRILDTFLFGLNMCLETTLFCGLIITQITRTLHVQIECVILYYSVVQLDNNIDYKDTLFFHGQAQYVFSGHFYKYIVCHIGYNDTLPPMN